MVSVQVLGKTTRGITMTKMIFLGPPNAGKGTIGAEIVKKFGLTHISTGDMFRENIKNQTPLGIEAKKLIDNGNLVPDDLTIKMVQERLSQPDCKEGFILDGFPRTIPQADALDKITDIDLVLVLEVPDSVIIERVMGRIQCRKCGAVFHKQFIPPKVEGVCDKCGGELYTRDDDNEEAIKARLKVYADQTLPLADYYGGKDILKRINADRPVVDIVADAIKAVEDV